LSLLIRFLAGRATPKKEINKKSRRQMVVRDQVAHQYLGDIAFQSEDRRSDRAKLVIGRSQAIAHIMLSKT